MVSRLQSRFAVQQMLQQGRPSGSVQYGVPWQSGETDCSAMETLILELRQRAGSGPLSAGEYAAVQCQVSDRRPWSAGQRCCTPRVSDSRCGHHIPLPDIATTRGDLPSGGCARTVRNTLTTFLEGCVFAAADMAEAVVCVPEYETELSLTPRCLDQPSAERLHPANSFPRRGQRRASSRERQWLRRPQGSGVQ